MADSEYRKTVNKELAQLDANIFYLITGGLRVDPEEVYEQVAFAINNAAAEVGSEFSVSRWA